MNPIGRSVALVVQASAFRRTSFDHRICGLAGADRGRDLGALERGGQPLEPRARAGVVGGQIDPQERARLHDPPRRGAVGLDPDRSGGDALGAEALAQQRDVVEAVEQRHHQPNFGADPVERRDEARRLGGDEQHIGRLGQRGRRVGMRGEVAQPDAPYRDPVVGDELAAVDSRAIDHDLLAGARQRRREEAADPTGPEDVTRFTRREHMRRRAMRSAGRLRRRPSMRAKAG